MNQQSIEQILVAPFGPFLDEEVLRDPKELKFTKDQHFLLDSLIIEQAGRRIGLDKIEDINERDKAPVRFRGTLRVLNIKWLSDEGQLWLTKDLKDRAPHLTLDYCIKEHVFRIIVQGTLLGNPGYLTSNKGSSLTIFSTNRSKTGRNYYYEVVSMHVSTYSRSRQFLSQYRTLRALNNVIAYNNSLPPEEQTPIKDRTPDWLVTSYLQYIRHRHELKRESDRTLHARHIHRSEVFELFGRHAGWLKDLIRRNRDMHKGAWERFCEEAGSRKTARRRGSSWKEIEDEWGDSENVAFEADDEDEEQHSVTIKSGSGLPPKRMANIPQAVLSSQEDDSEPEYDDIHGWSNTFTFNTKGHAPPRSHSPDVWSDSDRAQQCIPSIDPDILKQVPGVFFQHPCIEHDFIWKCPLDSCPYDIHVLDLTDTDLEDMHPDDQQWLKDKQWNLTDSRFEELFYDMVEKHYYMHFRNIGIKVLGYATDKKDKHGRRVIKERNIDRPGQLREDDSARLEWSRPRSHKFSRR